MKYTISDLKKALKGISGILVTPYNNDDKVEPFKLRPIIERALKAGIHLPVVNGNTGEFYSLTIDESMIMTECVAEMLDNRSPMIAGIGKNITDACFLTKKAVQAGASCLMIHQPLDPFVAPRGIIEYIKKINEYSQDIPLILYLRNDMIGTQTIVDLCAMKNVIGIKWATTNFIKLTEAMNACDSNIIWIGGLAELWAPTFYALGASGFTSGLINIWPTRSIEIYQALQNNSFTKVNKLIQDIKIFEDIRSEELNGTNVTAVKTALKLIKNDCGSTRPPAAWPLSERQYNQIFRFLKKNKLIN